MSSQNSNYMGYPMPKDQTREITNKILEAIEEGLLDRDIVIMACLKYMSESDVADMAHCNEFFNDDDESEEE